MLETARLSSTKLHVTIVAFELFFVRSTIDKMKGVAWLSIVGLLAFLCIVLCLLRFGIEEIQAGAIS